MTVELKIDDDSGKGVIFVKQTTVPASGPATVTTDTITVSVAQVPTAIAVSASPESINSGQGAEADAEPTIISVRLTDSEGQGIGGESLTVIASHGTLDEATGSAGRLGCSGRGGHHRRRRRRIRRP